MDSPEFQAHNPEFEETAAAVPAELLDVPAAVALARSWIGTPYNLGGRVRGAGADCATLLAEYLVGMGAATPAELEDLGIYSHDWFCHTDNERYLRRVMRHARQVAETVCRATVAEAGPGCLVLFRVARSRVYNHGAIVTEWPRGIHAVDPCVKESDLTKYWMTGHRQMDVFDPWGKG